MGAGGARSVPAGRDSSLRLLRLLQLASPALPVGAYAYSQGLEYAVHAGWVHDEASAGHWIGGVARHAVSTLDLPLLDRLHGAWEEGDADRVRLWNQRLLAARETRELREEDRHLGRSLARVLDALGVVDAGAWLDDDAGFACMFALAAVRWDIPLAEAQCAYLWSWAENQVLAAVKTVPLGQMAGQRLLHGLSMHFPGWVALAGAIGDEDVGASCVAQAQASALHETLYTRLFRS